MFPGSFLSIRYVARVEPLAALLIAGEPRALGVGRAGGGIKRIKRRPVGDIVLVKPWIGG